MSMKNSNDTIGNRTRDLPTCSAVPQPTAPPRPKRVADEIKTVKSFPLNTLNFWYNYKDLIKERY